MVLLIIIPMKNGYFIGKINPIFRQTQMGYPYFRKTQTPKIASAEVANLDQQGLVMSCFYHCPVWISKLSKCPDVLANTIPPPGPPASSENWSAACSILAETRARWNSTFPAQKKTPGSIRICQVTKSKIFGTRLQSQSGPLEHFLQLLGDFSHQHADTLDGYDTMDERQNSAPVGIPMKVTWFNTGAFLWDNRINRPSTNWSQVISHGVSAVVKWGTLKTACSPFARRNTVRCMILIRIYKYTCFTYLDIYIHTYIHIHINTYTYIYIYTYTSFYMCIYIYTFT